MRSDIGETVFIEDLEIGMSASLTKKVDEATVRAFADVSEDMNPIHLDPEVGRASQFGQRIAHGMLVSSLFSAILGNRLPGNGTVYLGQTLKFLAPVPVGSEVTATVAVSEVHRERRRVMLSCEAKVSGKLVVTGEATVLAPSRG
ncbi:MAG: MaoC family dehydratase [Rhodobacteraceae bacterium]|nr:MaoC family dehydratase [Paracoccaceae bacterium]